MKKKKKPGMKPYVLKDEPGHFKMYVESEGVINRMIKQFKNKGLEVVRHSALCRLEDEHDWQSRYFKHLHEVNKKAETSLADWKAKRVESQESIIRVYEAMVIPNWNTETETFDFRERPGDLSVSQAAKIVNDAIVMSLKLRGDDLDISHLYHVIEHKTDVIMSIVMQLIGDLVREKDMPIDSSQKFCYGLKNLITRDVLQITDDDMKSDVVS